jgi:hypothetical protein
VIRITKAKTFPFVGEAKTHSTTAEEGAEKTFANRECDLSAKCAIKTGLLPQR